MKKILSNERIIEIISECSALATGDAIKDVAEKVIREIRTQPLVVATDEDAALSLRATVEQFRPIIHPEYFKQLEQTDLYVVPKPICNAYADSVEGSIVIFDGLLQVLVFRMEISLLIARVKKHLDVVSAKTGISAETFQALAFRALSLSLHFLNEPESLPSLRDYFDEQLRIDASIAFGGGLLFILFHELGHLVLEHSLANDQKQSRNAPALACSEIMNLRKTQEFEADTFAFDAILPEARSAVIVNVWYVLSFFLDYETFVSGAKQTHPFSINRVGNLTKISGAITDPIIGTSITKMFDQRLKIIRSRMEETHPEQGGMTKATVARMQKQSLFTVLGTSTDGRIAVEKLLNAYHAIG